MVYKKRVTAMHLRKANNKKTGRTYLSIVHSYRDPEGKTKSKVIQSLGYLDALIKIYPDPIAHFTVEARKMEEKRKASASVTVTLDFNERVDNRTSNRKNYGYVVFSKIYHELEIDRFLDNARRHKPFTFNTEAIMRLLVYARLLYPGSKRASFLIKDRFFERFDFTIDDVYDGLTHFDQISGQLQQHLHEQVVDQYQRKTELVYYDVTNYYFEIDRQDEFRRNGCSKENRKSPIVQMGLLMDMDSLPISYKLFPGNTHDSQTLMPMLAEIKKRFNTKRIIVVADKGLNSGDNIAFNTALGDGYIYSKSIRGASADFKSWVLDESGYRPLGNNYKLKSKIVPDAKIQVTVAQAGKKKKKKSITIEQKWLAFYSEKYAVRAKRKRDEVIAKANLMIQNPAKYKSIRDYGAAGYIKNIRLDKDTGEILNTGDVLYLNQERIAEEEQLDGYYAIVTSELDDKDESIIEKYQGLWRIEETFKVSKSVLGTRPIYLRTQGHINAHFLICFISLLIARIVEKRLDGKYTIERITDTLQNVACSRINQNIWLFDYADDLTDAINDVFDVDIGRKFVTLQNIKKYLSFSKI
jgi:transposase